MLCFTMLALQKRTLFCSFCNESRDSAFWSRTQWIMKKAEFVNSSCHFNCCKSCSKTYNIDGQPAGCGSTDSARLQNKQKMTKLAKDRDRYIDQQERINVSVPSEKSPANCFKVSSETNDLPKSCAKTDDRF